MGNSEIGALCADIAKELGEGWSAASREGMTGAYLVHSDGRELHVWNGWNNHGKLAISGNFTRDMHDVYWFKNEDYKTNQDINVRADRGAVVIAREITRRLLPQYTETFARAQAAVTEQREAMAKREDVAGWFYAMLGKTPPERKTDTDSWRREQIERDKLKSSRTEISLYGLATGYGELYIDNAGESGGVNIRSIPVAKLKAIVEVLTA